MSFWKTEHTKIQESLEMNTVKKLSFEIIFAKFMTHTFEALQAILNRIKTKIWNKQTNKQKNPAFPS